METPPRTGGGASATGHNSKRPLNITPASRSLEQAEWRDWTKPLRRFAKPARRDEEFAVWLARFPASKPKRRRKPLTPEQRERQRAYDRNRWANRSETQRAQRREIAKAHDAVRWAIKHGKIIKPPVCENCGSAGRIEGHHADYSRRLEVQWLCRACHIAVHRKPPRGRS